MKRAIFLTIAILSGWISGMAQSGFNYKFLVTDNGAPLANASVNVRFTVTDGSTVIWQEEHTGVSTDANGIGIVHLGEGVRLGGTAAVFDEIDWSNNYSVQVELDTGSGYQTYSNEILRYVPKAKYALHADFNNLTNKPVTFYYSATTDYPTDITDPIYHEGHVALGTTLTDSNSTLYITNNETGYQKGIYTTVEVTDDLDKKNIYNTITGTGDGYLMGTANYISATGNGTHAGTRNQISDDGSGTHLGTTNILTGAGTGFQTGEYTQITNSGNNYHYGNYMELSGSGSGWHIGYVSYLLGDGTGTHVGNFNVVISTGDGDHYGTWNTVQTPGNGDLYGSYNDISGSGTGDKYGVYASINPAAGGSHYAVFGEATKAGSYAGYFNGDVKISQRLKANDSGDADMKAYIYGDVASDGTVNSNGSSDGFVVNKTGTGEYQILFVNNPNDASVYIALVTVTGSSAYVARVEKQADRFVVRLIGDGGLAVDDSFSFVVYKK